MTFALIERSIVVFSYHASFASNVWTQFGDNYIITIHNRSSTSMTVSERKITASASTADKLSAHIEDSDRE